jgi:hypothetical protein
MKTAPYEFCPSGALGVTSGMVFIVWHGLSLGVGEHVDIKFSGPGDGITFDWRIGLIVSSLRIGGNVEQIHTLVRFRLTKTQFAIIAPTIEMIFLSHQTRKQKGTSPLAFPFPIFPPPRGFNRGLYNQTFMDNTIALRQTIRANFKNSHWVKMDAFDLRAAIFVIRANVDYTRLLRRQEPLKRSMEKVKLQISGKARLPLDKSIAQLKVKSHRVIRSLERYMKRANRALIAAIGKEQYSARAIAWKAHLRWMRLHIAYCKPWSKPIMGLRKRQQQDLDDLMAMAKRGLHNAGYQSPEEKELRHIMRLYTRYARAAQQGHWTIRFLLAKKKDFSNTYHLAHFVIDRSKLKELKKS